MKKVDSNNHLLAGMWEVFERPYYTMSGSRLLSSLPVGTVFSVAAGEREVDNDGDVFVVLSDDREDYVGLGYIRLVSIGDAPSDILDSTIDSLAQLAGVGVPEFVKESSRHWDEHFSVNGESWYTAAEDVDRDVKNFLSEAVDALVKARGLKQGGGFVDSGPYRVWREAELKEKFGDGVEHAKTFQYIIEGEIARGEHLKND